MAKLAPCPLCGAGAIEHPIEGVPADGLVPVASCSNTECILHISYQDETNRHVLLEQWPKADAEWIDYETAVRGSTLDRDDS